MMVRVLHNSVAAGRARATGFSMIELIVVSVLMVILAAVIVPRIVGGEARRARVTAEAVRNLLSAAGEREAMTSQPAVLAFDADAPGGALLSLLSAPPPAESDGRATWRPDPFVKPVRLEGLELERCAAGGVVLNRRRWRIPLQEGEGRPGIELLLRQAGGDLRWAVSLHSAAIAASLAEVGDAGAAVAGPVGVIDLDETRGRDEPW